MDLKSGVNGSPPPPGVIGLPLASRPSPLPVQAATTTAASAAIHVRCCTKPIADDSHSWYCRMYLPPAIEFPDTAIFLAAHLLHTPPPIYPNVSVTAPAAVGMHFEPSG